MRVVCDTNVLVSGFLFGGHCRRILETAIRREIVLHASPAMLAELENVLKRPKFGLGPEQVAAVLGLFRETIILVFPVVAVREITDDPDDDRVLEAVLACQAETIVSGDRHLLALPVWRGIRIMNPATFVEQLTQSG
jgi:putative PIN family toxin of toxin-antitoxin system